MLHEEAEIACHEAELQLCERSATQHGLREAVAKSKLLQLDVRSVMYELLGKSLLRVVETDGE